MKRKIIRIDEEACNGCGLCAAACHEGAIGMADGKAKLLREDYCDGLGDCLPACPTGAITFVEREAPAYDAAAVKAAQAAAGHAEHPAGSGCPGSRSRVFQRPAAAGEPASGGEFSELLQWPVQIKLIPAAAPCLEGADLLIAADCTAYAYGNFHRRFMRGKTVLIGCPKLDDGDYTDKLTAIISGNDIRSVTVVRMEVPCCGGIESAVKQALQNSGKFLPWHVVVVSADGSILSE